MGFEYLLAIVLTVPLCKIRESACVACQLVLASSRKCLAVTKLCTVLLPQRHHRRSEGRGDHAQEHRLGHCSDRTIYRGVSRRVAASHSAAAYASRAMIPRLPSSAFGSDCHEQCYMFSAAGCAVVYCCVLTYSWASGNESSKLCGRLNELCASKICSTSAKT